MAADYIDYVVADAQVISPEDERWYSEKVVYLPGSYQVNDSQRRIAPGTPTRAEQGLPEGAFVFCCFNNNYKITPPVFDVWMRLLTQVPGSVLWLLQDNALAAANLRAEAQRRGVDPQRLVFAPRAKMEDHLARHRLADLFLDTQPYNAHTTTSDALWAGLPVVTCKGKAFPARVAASLLHAVDMPELVTHNLQDYEALALSLATSPERLSRVRERLAANIPGAPLFDTDLFRRRLESAYTTMWERARRGEAPSRIVVGLDANMDCGSSPQ
jgi:protein O-GlcNAc transferase